MYNLIKRALVTIDENEKFKLYKKEDSLKDKSGHNTGNSKNSDTENSTKDNAPEDLTPAVSLAKEKARVIIEEAEKEAEQIVEKAKKTEKEQQKKIEGMLEKAQNDIISKEEKIKKQWKDHYNTSIEALNKAQSSFEKSKTEYVEMTTEKIRIILSRLIEKILLQTLEENHQEVLEKKINEMVSRVMSLKEIVFKFNPNDIKVIPNELKEKMQETLSSFEIRQDASISRGGVIVETNYGTLDGTIENQLEIIDDMIDQVFGEEE